MKGNCEHAPSARNICTKCGKEIFYLDIGGGGAWITQKEYSEIPVSEPVDFEWKNKTGAEIVADIRSAINETPNKFLRETMAKSLGITEDK